MALMFERDADYQRWIAENPNGVLINIRRNLKPDYVVAHHALCSFMNRADVEPGGYTERAYRKVGAASLGELSAWVKTHIRADGAFTKHCHCLDT